jgi:hypothetical protein
MRVGAVACHDAMKPFARALDYGKKPPRIERIGTGPEVQRELQNQRIQAIPQDVTLSKAVLKPERN